MNFLDGLQWYIPKDALIVISGIFAFIGFVALLHRAFELQKELAAIACARKNWRICRKNTDSWLARHTHLTRYEEHECQILLQEELGALSLYTGLKGSVTRIENDRLAWLSNRMKENFIASLSDE